MRELKASHLVLMDVSMENLDGEWYPNPGVMIELGLLVKDPSKGLDSIYFFCDESTDRQRLPPMIPRVEVQEYAENDERFEDIVRASLEAFEKQAPEKLRLALEAQAATETMYENKKTSSV